MKENERERKRGGIGEREEVSGGKKINYIKQIKKTCKSEAPQKLLFHLLVAGLKKI